MKFEISRTSSWEGKPCEEAVRESHRRVDCRTCTEDEYDRRDLGNGKKWRDEGSNHRTIDHSAVKIARDFPGKRWVITINSLDELVAFYRKHGSLIVSASNSDPDEMELEIYDDYRE